MLRGEGNGNPLQFLAWRIPWTEEPGGLQSAVSKRVGHDEATSLSLSFFHALEKEMTTHSHIFAWEIPWTEEPGGLHRVTRVGYNLATKPPPPQG